MTFKPLPPEEQIGDDFLLGYNEKTKKYAAVRGQFEKYPFVIYGDSLWIVISEAVHKLAQLIVQDEPEKTRLLPQWNDETKKVTWQ